MGNVETMIEVKPQLMSADFLYHVSEWLLGNVPLSYFRDWHVRMFLDHRQCLNAAEVAFLQRFEGAYAEYTDWPEVENREYVRGEYLKKETHKAICGYQDPSLVAGTLTTSKPQEFRAG